MRNCLALAALLVIQAGPPQQTPLPKEATTIYKPVEMPFHIPALSDLTVSRQR